MSSANPLQDDFHWSLVVTRSDNLKLVFPLFFLIFVISETQENSLGSYSHLTTKFYFKKTNNSQKNRN